MLGINTIDGLKIITLKRTDRMDDSVNIAVFSRKLRDLLLAFKLAPDEDYESDEIKLNRICWSIKGSSFYWRL